jgi:tRNA threonylcarbamoyladenosine biosynthesis protein TsaB
MRATAHGVPARFESPSGTKISNVSVQLSVSRVLEAGKAVGPVLGIDTGSPTASLGVVADGRICTALSRGMRSHCAGLPEAVEEVLAAAGITMRDLTAVAVAVGPGSFTGLRIGLSYAKGFCLATNLAIVGISTLDAASLCVPMSELVPGAMVCPVLDARKGEIYTALYGFVSDALQKVTSDLVVPLKDLVSRVKDETVFIGDSKAEEARSLVMANGGAATSVGTARFELRGSFVAALGAARVANNDVDNPAALEPLYVRSPDASVNSAIRSGEGDYGTSRGRAYPAARRS